MYYSIRYYKARLVRLFFTGVVELMVKYTYKEFLKILFLKLKFKFEDIGK